MTPFLINSPWMQLVIVGDPLLLVKEMEVRIADSLYVPGTTANIRLRCAGGIHYWHARPNGTGIDGNPLLFPAFDIVGRIRAFHSKIYGKPLDWDELVEPPSISSTWESI